MAKPGDQESSNSIARFMVIIVALAIIIIATLTVTAIVSGPPAF